MLPEPLSPVVPAPVEPLSEPLPVVARPVEPLSEPELVEAEEVEPLPESLPVVARPVEPLSEPELDELELLLELELDELELLLELELELDELELLLELDELELLLELDAVDELELLLELDAVDELELLLDPELDALELLLVALPLVVVPTVAPVVLPELVEVEPSPQPTAKVSVARTRSLIDDVFMRRLHQNPGTSATTAARSTAEKCDPAPTRRSQV